MRCALEFDNLRFFGHRKHPQETPNFIDFSSLLYYSISAIIKQLIILQIPF